MKYNIENPNLMIMHQRKEKKHATKQEFDSQEPTLVLEGKTSLQFYVITHCFNADDCSVDYPVEQY